MSLDDYFTQSEAYSVHTLLPTYREYPDNPELADYTVQMTLVDETGNEYEFKHSHSSDPLHGRPLPQTLRNCRPGATIDPLTGECTDPCKSDQDCAMGYKCGDTPNGMKCLRETCSKDSECSSGKCVDGVLGGPKVCQGIRCDAQGVDEREFDHILEHYGANEGPYETRDIPVRCIQTPHYHLKGRQVSFDPQQDPRYTGMYS